MRAAERALSGCSDECCEAVLLAVAELSQNLIKYASRQSQPYAGTISVDFDADRVRVRAKNSIESSEDSAHVADLIAKLSLPETVPKELYRVRLRELLETPTPARTRLGLLRLANEGGFRLSCKLGPAELEIIAERHCDGSRPPG